MGRKEIMRELRRAYDAGRLVARQVRSDTAPVDGPRENARRLFDRGVFKAGNPYYGVRELAPGRYLLTNVVADHELTLE